MEMEAHTTNKEHEDEKGGLKALCKEKDQHHESLSSYCQELLFHTTHTLWPPHEDSTTDLFLKNKSQDEVKYIKSLVARTASRGGKVRSGQELITKEDVEKEEKKMAELKALAKEHSNYMSLSLVLTEEKEE